MTTFRQLLVNNGIAYKESNNSSLDEWFSSILDIPINDLGVGDIARAIRQDLFLGDVLPRAEAILKLDPLAGEDYDGQLISSIASLEHSEVKEFLAAFKRISYFLNHLDKSSLDKQIVIDIEKINKASHF
ncbi:hypothetical protein ABW09_16790 [Pluralibacter gergoviae]|uniref:contact-dependent growth inhibition system immunity protein n=1 Tax=Pluralibacter gergoviae TaxID=61647 RepID=UPI0006516DB9|nr:contact-dependent growth inhibition system immunity protein [Pluralibacter gergoviae]KMK16895.1 hypothetical protein ABW09_16790 [Pluralibacter gergoviae]